MKENNTTVHRYIMFNGTQDLRRKTSANIEEALLQIFVLSKHYISVNGGIIFYFPLFKNLTDHSIEKYIIYVTIFL